MNQYHLPVFFSMEGGEINVKNLCYQKHVKTSLVEGITQLSFAQILTVKTRFEELLCASKAIYKI